MSVILFLDNVYLSLKTLLKKIVKNLDVANKLKMFTKKAGNL